MAILGATSLKSGSSLEHGCTVDLVRLSRCIRIGVDAMERLKAQPRELAVTYYSGEGVLCPCSADGVMLAVSASPGQGSLQIASERSPPGTFAVVLIRPRKGGAGLKYTVPISMLPKLGQINGTIADPLARYKAVMDIQDLFTAEALPQ